MDKDNVKGLLKDKRIQISCLLFAVLLGNLVMGSLPGTVFAAGKNEEEPPREAETLVESIPEEETKEEEQPEEEIYLTVFVCGAVAREGVYVLPEEARVSDAIREAGGFTDEAQTDALNLAARIKDADMVRVPTKQEIENGTFIKEEATAGTTQTGSNTSPLVNLNTADKNTLMTLDGIGESKAEKIIAYREGKPFTKIEEIQNVSGIGPTIYEKLKEKITVQ